MSYLFKSLSTSTGIALSSRRSGIVHWSFCATVLADGTTNCSGCATLPARRGFYRTATGEDLGFGRWITLFPGFDLRCRAREFWLLHRSAWQAQLAELSERRSSGSRGIGRSLSPLRRRLSDRRAVAQADGIRSRHGHRFANQGARGGPRPPANSGCRLFSDLRESMSMGYCAPTWPCSRVRH